MTRATRLVMTGPDGARVLTPQGNLAGIELTEIPNNNAAAPISLEVEQQCDLDHWHRVARTPLPLYDTESWPHTEVAH